MENNDIFTDRYYFEILNIPRNATDKEIKAAYYRESRNNDSSAGSAGKSPEEIKQQDDKRKYINKAYHECLKKPYIRKQYIEQLEQLEASEKAKSERQITMPTATSTTMSTTFVFTPKRRFNIVAVVLVMLVIISPFGIYNISKNAFNHTETEKYIKYKPEKIHVSKQQKTINNTLEKEFEKTKSSLHIIARLEEIPYIESNTDLQVRLVNLGIEDVIDWLLINDKFSNQGLMYLFENFNPNFATHKYNTVDLIAQRMNYKKMSSEQLLRMAYAVGENKKNATNGYKAEYILLKQDNLNLKAFLKMCENHSFDTRQTWGDNGYKTQFDRLNPEIERLPHDEQVKVYMSILEGKSPEAKEAANNAIFEFLDNISEDFIHNLSMEQKQTLNELRDKFIQG